MLLASASCQLYTTCRGQQMLSRCSWVLGGGIGTEGRLASVHWQSCPAHKLVVASSGTRLGAFQQKAKLAVMLAKIDHQAEAPADLGTLHALNN